MGAAQGFNLSFAAVYPGRSESPVPARVVAWHDAAAGRNVAEGMAPVMRCGRHEGPVWMAPA